MDLQIIISSKTYKTMSTDEVFFLSSINFCLLKWTSWGLVVSFYGQNCSYQLLVHLKPAKNHKKVSNKYKDLKSPFRQVPQKFPR